MADLENKAKEAVEQTKDLARATVDDVKVEADQLKTDAKGYAQGALEDVKSEGKEVIEELKAAVKKETLDSSSTVGGAGYREKEGDKPNGIAIASVAFGLLAILLKGWVFKCVLGVVSLVLGAKARKEKQTMLATVGFCLGAVGVILALIGLIF